jgi:hypothetical protein
MAKKKIKIKWLSESEEHDYPAAKSFLSLIFDDSAADAYVEQLRRSPISEFKSKDIFRASGLSLLGISNEEVKKDQRKIESEQKLSPILLVRDSNHGKVIIADGYHRLCAIYSLDENAVILCKIV